MGSIFECTSTVWYHEESVVLLNKRNGNMEWKSFWRNFPVSSGRLTAEILLKHLILRTLVSKLYHCGREPILTNNNYQFQDSLYAETDFVLQFPMTFQHSTNSCKAITCLCGKSDLENDVILALEVEKICGFSTSCNKIFVNYYLHAKGLCKFVYIFEQQGNSQHFALDL